MDYISPQDLPALGIRFSRSHIWKLEQRGDFPKRLRYSPRRYHWRADEIHAWLETRHATARPTVPPVHGTTIADDLKSVSPRNPLPFEAEHETATA
jgi:predicted DNA-binding transcriptional regulator AlpA